MAIMEKLYNQGFLSYPRTETTQYSSSIDLRSIVNRLAVNESFGKYAEAIASGKQFGPPRKGP